jgi:hypothetical protein
MADPLLPHPCKVANSVGVFIEFKSGQRLNHKAVRLRLARLLTYSVSLWAMQACGPPHQNHENRDALYNYNLNGHTTTARGPFSRG